MKLQKPILVILAAGLGSRYGGLKQLDSVGPNDETLIDYSVYDAIQAGFSKIVFVIRHYFEDDFRKKLLSRYESHIPCECAFQELEDGTQGVAYSPDRSKPWGTGQAALVTEQLVDAPFSVINADDFYGRNSLQSIAEFLSQPHLSETTEFAMVGFTLRNTLSEYGSVSRGICTYDESWYLESVIETTRIFKRGNGAFYLDRQEQEFPLTGNEIASMNFWGFTPRIFPFIKQQFREFLHQRGSDLKAEFYLPAVVNNLLQSGDASVKVLPTTDSWFGITYREDKMPVVKKIAALIEKGIYPKRLWK
jgi:dTDP-glucose pyrophosphorylase